MKQGQHVLLFYVPLLLNASHTFLVSEYVIEANTSLSTCTHMLYQLKFNCIKWKLTHVLKASFLTGGSGSFNSGTRWTIFWAQTSNSALVGFSLPRWACKMTKLLLTISILALLVMGTFSNRHFLMLGGIVNERFLNNKERSELEATSSCVVSRLDVVGFVQDF